MTGLPSIGIRKFTNFEGSVYIWNWRTGERFMGRPPGYNNRMYRVVFSPDGKTLASCGDDSRIVLWDLSNGVAHGLEKDPQYLIGHAGRVLDLAFSADSKLLSSAGINIVLLWEASTGKLRATFRDHQRDVTCVAFSPDGTMLLSGDANGKVILRNAATAAEARASGW